MGIRSYVICRLVTCNLQTKSKRAYVQDPFKLILVEANKQIGNLRTTDPRISAKKIYWRDRFFNHFCLSRNILSCWHFTLFLYNRAFAFSLNHIGCVCFSIYSFTYTFICNWMCVLINICVFLRYDIGFCFLF